MNLKPIILAILLIASPAIAKDITLEWDYDGTCEEFRVYRSQGTAHWPEMVGTVDYPTTEFTDVDIPHGDLSYIVTAHDGEQESNASNEVELAYYYALVKYDYDVDGRILYRGENADIDALDSDTDWVITRFYYNAWGMITEMRVRTTSWTNRATGW